jgi:flavin reductase (DIM6/NTAB) family NADH-FMN oxidoreductase RutF
MKIYEKRDFPLEKIRRFLEPGPVVLVSSAWRGERDIMTMGWHMMLDYQLFGCFIWDQNRSRKLIQSSKECVINVPTFDMIDAVIGVGNTHGPRVNKFRKFGLTPIPGEVVKAPLIAECFANFECRLIDTQMVRKYSLFIFDFVKAHVAKSPRYPKTVHYRGDGVFMVSGRSVDYRRRFKPQNL